MYRYSLNIIIISFLLINSVSFGMLITDHPIHKLPEDILRNIFVIASPSTQNQLKICCKVWHAIGAKKAPNMYKLVDNESFRPSEDDWHYMMMHAGWDKRTDIMLKILNRTEQRTFVYDFRYDRSFYLCNMPVIQDLLDSNKKWKEGAPEKFRTLDITTNPVKSITGYSPLLHASFIGNIEWMKIIIDDLVCLNNKYCAEIDHALYMAVYHDNPYYIEMLAFLRNKRESNIDIPLHILELAIRKKKKKAFEALVKHNVYGCLNAVRLDYVFGEINTTVLDELGKIKITDIPHINEYILSYAKSLVVKIL